MTDPHDPLGPPPAAPPAQSSGVGGLLAIVVLMLVVGGAIGFFAGPIVLDEDDEVEVSATDGADTTTTTAAAVDPTVWAEVTGTFEAAVPEGWSTGSDMYGPGQRALLARPGTAIDSLYDAGGLTLTFDRRPDLTPEDLLDVDPPAKCPTAGGREPFSQGDYAGFVDTFTGCPNGFELRRIAVAVPGGTNLLVSAAALPGEDAAAVRALDTFVAGAKPETQIAPLAGCADIEASTDAEFPNSLVFRNHLNEQVSYGRVDPATDQVAEPTDLESGFVTGTNFVKPGTIYRFTTPSGDVDYTATAEQYQCAVLNDEGVVTIPN